MVVGPSDVVEFPFVPVVLLLLLLVDVSSVFVVVVVVVFNEVSGGFPISTYCERTQRLFRRDSYNRTKKGGHVMVG